MQLKEYLEKNNITQEKFAKKLGVTQQTVSLWCSGATSPDKDMAIKVIKVTKGKVTLVDLWGAKFAGVCPR